MKAICVLCLLISQGALAQDALLGRWKVEMVDPPEPLVFEFLENEVLTITEIDSEAEPTYHTYKYDPAKKTLSLGELYSTEYETRIEMISPKQFRLYFHPSIADSMLEDMDISFPSQEEQESLNATGKRFMTQFIAGMKKLITSIPILDAKRL